MSRYVGSRFEAENWRLLIEAQSIADENVVSDLLPAHPQLLNAYVQKRLVDRLPQQERDIDNRAYYLVGMFREARRFLEERPHVYPIGRGPVEPIWTEVTQKYVSQPYAARQVAEPDVIWRLSGAYMRALSRYAYSIAQRRGAWRDGWALQELLLAAVMALPTVDDDVELRRQIESDFAFMYEETASDWLLTALSVLGQAPDGRVYMRAQALGNDLLKRLRRKNESEQVGRVLFRLAGLSMDPYGGLPLEATAARQALRRRLIGELDSAEIEAIDWAEADMPPPSEALGLAEAQYRESATLRTGGERGLALKGHFEALLNLKMLGRRVSDSELRIIAQSAISHLDPHTDEPQILSIRAAMRRAGLT